MIPVGATPSAQQRQTPVSTKWKPLNPASQDPPTQPVINSHVKHKNSQNEPSMRQEKQQMELKAIFLRTRGAQNPKDRYTLEDYQRNMLH